MENFHKSWIDFVSSGENAEPGFQATLAYVPLENGNGDSTAVLDRLSEEDLQIFKKLTHQRRKQHWLAGRKCLLAVKDEIRKASKAPILTSLSHSPKMAVAIGYVGNKLVQGVGIDIESTQRLMSENALDRIVTEPERNLPLKAIEFWTIKEACFKANPASAGTVIPQYVIENYDPKLRVGTACYSTSHRFRFKIESTPEITAAFSICW